MRARRWSRASLAVMTAGAFATAGCGLLPAARADPAPSTAAAADASEDLLKAARKVSEQPVSVKTSISGDLRLVSSGVWDTAARSSHASMVAKSSEGAIGYEIVAIEDDVWLKATGIPDLPAVWGHKTREQLRETRASGVLRIVSAYPGSEISDAAVEVKQAGKKAFTGSMDLTKGVVPFISPEILAAWGDKAKRLPFTATVDHEGRLNVVVVDLGGLQGGGKLEILYGYGSPVDIKAPV